MKTRLLVIGSFLLAFPLVASLSCVRPCSKVRCSTPVGCRGGTVKSVCGCCTVCAKMEGERCGGQWETEGRCDSGLKCVVRGGRLKSGIGQCEPAICKEKKCGFREVCTVGKDGFPYCSCSHNCSSYIRNPVCGYSNGKQYDNKCELHKEECTMGQVIGVMQGPCKKCLYRDRAFLFGETRKGRHPCEKCNCFHGEWRCRRTSQCGPQKSRSCTVTLNSLGRNVQSDCPKGYWCKVQIPGIPEAGIPEVAMCVPGLPTGDRAIFTTTVSTEATRLRGPKIPARCMEPPSVGPCKAAFPRWYYNKSKKKCQEFLYGGCDGNANNFNTKAACKDLCIPRNRSSKQVVERTTPSPMEKTKTPELPIERWRELCILPRVVGPCRASFPRWYYNKAVKKCLKFMYGGCEGNMNNFRTKAECKKRCIRRRIKARARSGSVWSHYSLRRRIANSRRYRHG